MVDGKEVVSIKLDSLKQLLGYQFENTRLSYYLSFNHKINRRHLIKFGINTDMIYMNQNDTVANQNFDGFLTRWDCRGTSFLIQPFAQWKWRANENMDVTAGIHSQYFSLSESLSPIEPRLGWKYRMRKNQSIFAGAGLHSQTQPCICTIINERILKEMLFDINQRWIFQRVFIQGLVMKSHLRKNLNLRTEVYYQELYNVPVDVESSSSR